MQTSILTLTLTLLMAGLAAADEAKPNILFFLADDQRSDLLGCSGHSIVKTPAIDRLAADGVRFENSFCQTPICAASRASLFTGLTQRTHGYNFGTPPVAAEHLATSYPVLLKQAGYRTGFAGKFGITCEPPDLAAQFDFFRPIHRSPYLKALPDGSLRHETDLCTDAAIEFIRNNPTGQPFCLSVSFNAPHAEDHDQRPGFHFQWPESADGLYEDLDLPAPRLGGDSYFDALPPLLQEEDGLNRARFYWRWDTPAKYQVNLRAHYRMISGIDQAVSRVLDELKAHGLDQTTIIVYSSDNGFMLGDRGLAGKWNHYDQSLRVPLIIHDPRLPAERRGRVVHELVNNIDLAPTFLQWAGTKPPELYQGHSLVPLLTGEPGMDWPDGIYCEHQFKSFNNWRGVRTKRHKYAVYYDEPGGPYQCLYDLEADPDETVNLATNPEYAAVLTEMTSRLDGYLEALPDRAAPATTGPDNLSESGSGHTELDQ